ncbi:universal stress protein [Natronobacterium gregoryi]|uniref:Universal stress protein n=2 Tax=Natronobacterium gregoryi TaxID=44930 RepID=L0AFX0_NATGS|nr:universal stress protein [Natronobacterium gregoryi]AFZ71955.1 universal stress protein UspA-like protein [Natronobacterium gregoryi SP2]ELY62548.1 UspA domain-containing protein [Natronobacterium gregoryi SP2]PLK20731.1 universal stress protein [Natronobacterium gregoryi SP2]SFJ12889.1 Nucleotide-binding universal stress protein, UspA family [Natronobacterium gregoryi]
MNLLVAIDGSNESTEALDYAIDIADAMDGSITVAHAVNPTVFDEGGTEPLASLSDADQRLIVEGVADAEQRALGVLEEAVEFATGHGHDVESELLYGDPATEIAEYADEEEVDAIFVGHRGRTERVELMVGSVAKALVERAPVPVTVVR